MITGLKLAILNAKYILFSADVLAMRFALAVGSVFWASWIGLSYFVYPGTLDDFDLPFGEARLVAWAMLFFIHGVSDVTALLTGCHNKKWAILRSMIGAALWTVSLDIVLLVRLSENTLPMGGAHWLAAIIAWWIFMRDIFGKPYHA